MAERRMFTRKVTDDDRFTSLSSSAQALYLHLSMTADDDGFNNQVSTAMFKAHASVQDIEALLDRRYIYQFDDGVIVIKHWRMANALRKDRYTETSFKEDMARLKLDENGAYTQKIDHYNDSPDDWLPFGCQMVATGKDSIDKGSIGNIPPYIPPTGEPPEDPYSILADCSDELKLSVTDWLNYKKERNFRYKPTALKTLLNKIKTASEQYGDEAVVSLISNSISNGYQGIVWDNIGKGSSGTRTEQAQREMRAAHDVTAEWLRGHENDD